MRKKKNAGAADSITPVVDPFGGFQQDDYRLRAVESRHKTARAIAKTQAWAGVWRAAILASGVAGVLACAVGLGMPVPWDLLLLLARV